MHLATITDSGGTAILAGPRGVIAARALADWATGDLLGVIRSGRVEELRAAAADAPEHVFRTREDVTSTAPYRHSRLIWGIGLNYVDHAQRNPRFLTRAKNFPGFFSFGPEIVPLAEAVAAAGSLADIEVSTVVNGTENPDQHGPHMRFSPAFLVSFHSHVMPLEPGDIISPGTPGAIHVRPGDTAECRIPGVSVLRNPVVQG